MTSWLHPVNMQDGYKTVLHTSKSMGLGGERGGKTYLRDIVINTYKDLSDET